MKGPLVAEGCGSDPGPRLQIVVERGGRFYGNSGDLCARLDAASAAFSAILLGRPRRCCELLSVRCGFGSEGRSRRKRRRGGVSAAGRPLRVVVAALLAHCQRRGGHHVPEVRGPRRRRVLGDRVPRRSAPEHVAAAGYELVGDDPWSERGERRHGAVSEKSREPKGSGGREEMKTVAAPQPLGGSPIIS